MSEIPAVLLREKRSTCGVRSTALEGEDANFDQEFYNSEFWGEGEESDGESYDEEKEEASPDEFDSDFNDTEDEGEEDSDEEDGKRRKTSDRSRKEDDGTKQSSKAYKEPSKPKPIIKRKVSFSEEDAELRQDKRTKIESADTNEFNLSRTVRESTKNKSLDTEAADAIRKEATALRQQQIQRMKQRQEIKHQFTQEDLLKECLETELNNIRWVENRKALAKEDESVSEKLSKQIKEKDKQIRHLSKRGQYNVIIFPSVESMPPILMQDESTKVNHPKIGIMSDSKSSKKRQAVEIEEPVLEKYARGSVKFNTEKVKYKALRLTLQAEQERVTKAAEQTAAVEILLPGQKGYIAKVAPESEETEYVAPPVYSLKQSDMKRLVDLNTAKNQFDLQLHNFGPYFVNYSRNGRNMIFGGRKGHVATMDCHTLKVGTELQLQEEIHDVRYLHNESMFAVAQKEYTYIYDANGTEVHVLRDHRYPFRLDFLPYHYLLVSVGKTGIIRWQDISIGTCVGSHVTGYGACNVMKHNPHNSVSHLGHRNGVVSLWSPSSGKALVTMLCHPSPITDIAIDREGHYMATAGYDNLLKLWDLRTYRTLKSFQLDGPAKSIDISDTGLVALAIRREVQILNNPFTKGREHMYMKHEIRTPNIALSSGGGVVARTNSLKSSVLISNVKFRPLEDVAAIGHTHGLTTIIVPGAGEANYDSYEANPFRTTKQRQEDEVQTLLGKLSPDMIALDSKFVGTVDKDFKTLQQEHNELFGIANAKKSTKEKKKMRGKNKIAAKLRRKQKNVIDSQTEKLKEKLKEDRDKQNSERKAKVDGIETNESSSASYDPLKRFDRKR